jgi:hypothetical protein
MNSIALLQSTGLPPQGHNVASPLARPNRAIHAIAQLALILSGTVSLHAGGESPAYDASVIVRGLERPTGIIVQGSGTLFLTQVPTPGVGGAAGGRNTVDKIEVESGVVVNVTTGEPEPTHLALDRHGTLYWTCKSAGVILQRTSHGGVSLFLGGLQQPSGIAVDAWDNVYFTSVPTPGLPGSMGGMNTVNVTDGNQIMVLTRGEPEPTDIAVSEDGTAYWTCKSANVILSRSAAGVVSVLLRELDQPVGIALDHQGRKLFFTEVPTPGMPGSRGGRNRVSEYDLRTGELEVVDFGDSEPTDVAVARNGDVFWTCSSAGVIVRARRLNGRND